MATTLPDPAGVAETSSIRPIDQSSVHRIHSGQVILSLENAVKELLENSLDAGASIVEIRIKDNGLDSLEVIDNGCGIAEPDWASLALKHHTSKLSNVPPSTSTTSPTSTTPGQPDLTRITTYGFRGEALSALCALCEKVQVITCTTGMKGLARILSFDREGRLLPDTPEEESQNADNGDDNDDKSVDGVGHAGAVGGKRRPAVKARSTVARQRGTTVILHKLFQPLPVRRKEFERNAKKEFAKALGTLTGYGLVPCSGGWGGDDDDHDDEHPAGSKERRGVRLIVDGANKAGKRTNHLRTTGAPSLPASITSLFGPKSLHTLMPVDLKLSVDIDRIMAKREGLDTETKLKVRVVGMISKAESGMGRTGGGAQYWYLNGRPFNPGKIARAVNETYKSYNSSQTPFVVLDFKVPKDSVDINVSPDKKTIYLHSEANLIQSLVSALEDFYEPSRGTYLERNVSAPTLRGMSSRPADTGSIIHADKEASPYTPQAVQVAESEEGPREVSLKRDRPIPTWSPSPEPRKRTRSARSPSPTSPLRDLAPRPFGGTPTRTGHDGLAANGLLPGTPSQVRALPASHFTPTDRKVLEYEEEDDELMDSGNEAGSVTGPDGGSHRAVSVLDSDNDEAPRRGPSKLVQPTLIGLGAGWKLTRQQDDGNLSDRAPATKPTRRDTKLSFRDRLAGFASQTAKVDTTMADSDSDDEDDDQEEASRVTRTVEVIQPDVAERNEPNSEGIDLDLVTMLEEEDETPRDNLISTIDLPGIGRPSRASEVEQQGETQDPIQYIAETSATRGESSKRREFRDEIATRASKREVVISCDLDRIRESFQKARRRGLAGRQRDPATSKNRTSEILPAAGVSNQDSTEVDRTLSRVIKKQDFAGMRIIGQYNKAFIIARRRVEAGEGEGSSDDLFIIDQHAADEKYNFETLQAITKIQSQRLIQPKKLDLTAADEVTVMENLDIFGSNGFGITVDEDAPYGQGEKIRLIAMPVSKETTFDEKGKFGDLKELIFLLQEQYIGTMVRCKKARAMFASRACRKSVMFGHALNARQMESVTRHMGEIEHPWNCPHGRPTMRHLVNMQRLATENSAEVDYLEDKLDWKAISTRCP